MQLILESEPTLAIEREMSGVEDIQNEKIGNVDIELKDKTCNGNKENIADVNIIPNDEINKQVVNEENDAASIPPADIKLENNEDKKNIVDTIKEDNCEVDSPKEDAQIEESQNNGTDEEINNSNIKKEAEDTPVEPIQESIAEDEKDISVKEENINQILDVLEKDSDKVIKNDDTSIKKESPDAIDDVEVIEEPAATPLASETIQEVNLGESSNKPESPKNEEKDTRDSKTESEKLDDTIQEKPSNGDYKQESIELKDDMDVEEIIEETNSNKQDTVTQAKDTPSTPVNSVADKPVLCKLSNTLDILSDDEEELPKTEPPKVTEENDKQCINIEDDDDIMLIDEDTSKTETPKPVDVSNKEDAPINADDNSIAESGDKTVEDTTDLFTKADEKESTPPQEINNTSSQINIDEKQEETTLKYVDKPLVPDNFLKSAKKNLSDMTREDLEEFCVLKIVESIVDRSNLSEIKNKLKTMAQGIEEYRKKTMMLTKQNRDLQVVLKSIQEEQKKNTPGTPITPLKITRSVGMQVFMEKPGVRRKNLSQLQNVNNIAGNRPNAKNAPGLGQSPTPRLQKVPISNQPIPVPRLVPANIPAMKSPSTVPVVNQISPTKTPSPVPNGIKNSTPTQKSAEKRQHNRIMSVTVDLTDDEPPAKINNRTSPAPPVRVVPSQNLMANPRQQFATSVSSPRKVYIPISGPQNQNIRPGQTIMLKSVPTPGLRPRCPAPPVPRAAANTVRMNRIQTGRHPAPLPDAMKQYQPPNWKALPPAPDLKLSKVENGIVISWKIEGYQEDSYEEIASYQLYAYQETSSPPSTSLWKKIGDVKALPLPMACTLTQFMAGFKYYFAVRAVDIRSRLGPFSLPGSILLLNKL